jgi:hypothetical protein
MSVADKARALTAEASRIREGSAAEHDAERVVNRVDEILVELERLRRLVAAADRLNEVSGSERVALPGLDDGQAALARHSRAGPPSNQAFSAAKQKIGGVISRVSTALRDAWSAWTSELIAELPLSRVSLLAAEQQESARECQSDLQQLTRLAVPSRADVSQFLSCAQRLAEMLAEVPDLPDEATGLIRRLGQRPTLTLANLTDTQITLLRQTGIAGQIELRWRGI